MTISNITNIAQTASVYVHSNSESKLFSLVTDASIPALFFSAKSEIKKLS